MCGAQMKSADSEIQGLMGRLRRSKPLMLVDMRPNEDLPPPRTVQRSVFVGGLVLT